MEPGRVHLLGPYAVPGLAVTGGWIAGTGLASIVGHAQECARGLAVKE